ncbi:MAG: VIT and vWA domain-containing protein [Planctomycetota bacterium]|jgi:Ca-activated chloride channel family protein
MRRLLAAALLLTLGAGAAPAQQARLDISYVVPQQRVFSLRRTPAGVRIDRVRARVKILEQTATTELEVALANPGSRPAESVLLLPVPDGAAVHSFTFHGAAREPSARLLPKAEARRVYDEIVARTRDPALLEFAGYNLVRTSVFPVPARGTQKVRLTYHHLLHASDNRVDYVLPRSEALDVKVPWEILVDLKSKSPISTVYSPSHEFHLHRRDVRHFELRVKEREPGSFRLSYLRDGQGVTASLFAYPDPKVGGGYFLLLAGVPARLPAKGRLAREVTLVLDRSGSMAGPKLDQVRQAALQVVEGLDDGEAFNLIDYGNDVALFAPQPVLKNAETTARARAYLARLRPRGGTNIHDALVEALRQKPRGEMLPLVLFLTDGLPTIGRTSESAIREAVEKGNPHRRRVFTFGVGHDVNAPLLDRIAEMTRATNTYVLPDEDVEVKVGEVFRRLYGPVVADAKIETLDGRGQVVTDRVRELIPAVLPDLFEGDQLVLLGQYRGEGPLRFRVEGSYPGERRTFVSSFDLKAATTRNAFVPRLWASRRIAFLIDQIRQATGADDELVAVNDILVKNPRYRELVDEILRLSTQFGILTEYTSFLATEGTDLSNWGDLNLRCGREIDDNAVRLRWGEGAVSQAKNFKAQKGSIKLNRLNRYLDQKLQRVEFGNVQQIQNRTLFRQGASWIDGRLVAEQRSLKADRVVGWGTPEYRALLDAFIEEGCQGVLSFRGSILVRHKDETILIRNR